MLPASVKHRPWGSPAQGQDLLDNSIHRSAKDNEVGLMHGGGEVEERFVDGPDCSAPGRGWPADARAENALRDAPPLGGQPDGPADESHANDGKGLDLHPSPLEVGPLPRESTSNSAKAQT